MITSAENKLIKYASSLKQKKYRQVHNQFLAEGLRNVLDIIFYDHSKVKNVFVSSGQKDKFLFSLRELAKAKCTSLDKKLVEDFISTKVFVVEERLIKKICDTISPQEIVAIVDKKQESSSFGKFLLYLDRIQDPGNLGTIIRSAVGAGFFVIFDGCADIFSPKVVRSSMSAIMKLDFMYAKDDTIFSLKEKGFLLACADSNGKNLFNLLPKQKICVIIGNEANGASDKILKISDTVISIPMQNNIESLNAAVSSAIIMYYLRYASL